MLIFTCKKSGCELHMPVENFVPKFSRRRMTTWFVMKMFFKQLPIKRTNSRGRTKIIAGSTLFCQKISNLIASFKFCLNFSYLIYLVHEVFYLRFFCFSVIKQVSRKYEPATCTGFQTLFQMCKTKRSENNDFGSSQVFLSEVQSFSKNVLPTVV